MRLLILAFFVVIASCTTSFNVFAVDNGVALVASNNEVSEMPELIGKYYIGGGGLYGNPMILHVTDNDMERGKEVLIELDLDGAKLIRWEFNSAGSSISAYVNELLYSSGIIRFTPNSSRIGDVVSFYYELEKNGSVKVGHCTFRTRR